MIINGDWSWAEYLANPKIDAAICVLPDVSETGLAMQPMVATKGYSLNRNTTGEQARLAIDLVRFLLSEQVQAEFST
jgi:maltose-binding protein MalE